MKPCSICGKDFSPRNTMQRACSWKCAAKVGPKLRKEKARQDKARKEAQKTLPELKKEAQEAFNAFIRERDKDLPCFCCGGWPKGDGALTGGQWDAGHFYGRGAHPELALEEVNVNRQLKSCNRGDWNRIEGHKELVRRWGLEAVEKLKEYRPPQHLKRDDYRAIRERYKQKLKELKGKK